MKEVTVQDDGGDTMNCVEHNGHLFPNFPAPNGIECFDSLEIRNDDVIIATFPKSGTHWVREVTDILVAGTTTPEEVPGRKGLIEMIPNEVADKRPSPRFLLTHVQFGQLPAGVKEKKPKTILVVRNPKDVAVSFHLFMKSVPFLKYSGKFENFVRPYAEGKFFYGSWFDYMRSWYKAKTDNPDLPILVLYFEDMKEDLKREMNRICSFLNLDRSDDFLNEVVDFTSFKKMKARKGEEEKSMYRKGQIGDWKNWFTVAQSEWFDKFYEENTKDFPDQIRFT